MANRNDPVAANKIDPVSTKKYQELSLGIFEQRLEKVK